MPLSWNEIRDRALAFSKEWEAEISENAEAKSYWDAFFNVFGVSRRRVASFEVPVRRDVGGGGFIDLLWKGTLLVEHKSAGKDLDSAYRQARDYFPGLKDRDLPHYVAVSDFARIRLYDLDSDAEHEFALKDFPKNVRLFGFVAGYQTRSYGEEDPVNVRAVERLGELHDRLQASGYAGRPVEVLLVRLLFCMFAEDTGVFEERRQFQDYLEQRTAEDGSDLGMHLESLFEVLNTPYEHRQSTLDEDLAGFKYVDGRLFEERLPIPAFDRAMRETLLECCALEWSRISPAIFGSLFQFVMTKERRKLGAHYTSERNILKALGPLFLDGLREELDDVKRDNVRLEEFHRKLGRIRVFDPACGCGNFLVVAYRELRLIELEVLQAMHGSQQVLEAGEYAVLLDVDQFYGIEIEEFPVQVAQVALWLTDHQMNMRVSEQFGRYFVRLPLRKAPNIVRANAIQLNWEDFCPATNLTFIVGNPPFVGGKFMSAEQRADRQQVFDGLKGVGLLDYVTCWYGKTAAHMQLHPEIRAAFVSTNSITQGEQVGVLWPYLSGQHVRINFAHRTFRWTSEARGKSAVHCVIVGFALGHDRGKRLFDYDSPDGDPHETVVKRINPYLVDAPDLVVTHRSRPLCPVPAMGIGNKPIDGGNYLFTPEEKAEFLAREPAAAQFFKRWLGADEFLNGYERWCLWLGDCPPEQLRRMPESLKRVAAVRDFRLASKSPGTRQLADRPTRFHVENMPNSEFLVVPKVSSERRSYIPIGFRTPDTLASDLLMIVSGAGLYHFGVLQSAMHMGWVRTVCGRLESRYRYSVDIVYNNFPWPESRAPQRVQAIEQAAREILTVRDRFPDATLADLYDPVTMPSALRKAHTILDRAVDAAYRSARFAGERNRVEFLFQLYQQYSSPITALAERRTHKKRKGTR
jgi:hypothetical protein